MLARRAHPQEVQIRTEALRRAPSAPHQTLSARVGLHEREQSLADGLGRVGGEALLARADRPRPTRESTGIPCEETRCSIASSRGMPLAHCTGSAVSSGRLIGTCARKAGMMIAFSAFARRTAASNERREIACPVNGSRMRRTGRGRLRAASRPFGGSQ